MGSAPPLVADSIVWAKLRALADGAEIASGRLWGVTTPIRAIRGGQLRHHARNKLTVAR